MADKAAGKLTESEIKTRLAQAEVHFSHYRWDDAVALFEAVLAAYPDHPAATQGWAYAVEQKSIDEELGQAVDKARASLEAHRFDEALSLLNHAQTRGALSHILRYHSEIDGLRSEAQEGLEWQRRIEVVGREAETLAGRRRYDQALEVLDNTLRALQSSELNGRGWERLGARLARMRDRLWAERDVAERVQFAQSAYERQDYRLATELAAALHEELPEHDDVRRLHERARGAWGRLQSQLAAVDEALAQERTDDALALLGALRSEHPRNPDWQAITLRMSMNHGRQEMSRGRSAMVEHEFEDAAEAFEHAHGAFTSTVEIFPGHPTAALEQAEAAALRDAALSARQAVRDRAAFRWEAAWQGWQASRELLARAVALRDRDFGEVVAVVDAMSGEAQAALTALEQARLMLAEGRQALQERDAGRGRDAFRSGLARIEAVPWRDAADVKELREQLAAGVREAERVQKDVRKLLSAADAIGVDAIGAQAAAAGGRRGERLKLLRRAYEQWETAPDLASRLADELLAQATAAADAEDEAAALAYCEQVRELTGAPGGALAAAGSMGAAVRARRAGKAALVEASTHIETAKRTHPPSAQSYSEALAILQQAAPAIEDAKELAPQFDALRKQAEDGHKRALAAQPLLVESEALAASGDWAAAARMLAEAQAALGPLSGSEMTERLAQFRAWADTIESVLAPAGAALARAESIYALAADGDLSEVDWDALERALGEVRKALRRQAGLPSPLPAAWDETRSKAEALARRSKVLRGVHDKIAAGSGVDAIPALQAEAGPGADPVVLAVLSRLLQETTGDAVLLARKWVTEAVAALGRGELATAEPYLALAQSYAAAAPQVIPEIRRTERQIAVLGQVRGATTEAREQGAKGQSEAALSCFRRALELAADGDAGLPSAARRKLHLLLDLEDDLAGQMAAQGRRDEKQAPSVSQGDALLRDLLDWDASQPLVGEFVVPALARWWKLACRAAGLAYAEAQMTLGRDSAAHCAVAVESAAGLVESYPRDRAALALYGEAATRGREQLVARIRRRLERAHRLADRGAYAQAAGELALADIAPGGLAPGSVAELTAKHSEEVEALVDEAADLRAELEAVQRLAERLSPLLEQVRESGLTGNVEAALAARSQAEFIDPQRRVALMWREFDALAALVTGWQKPDRPRLLVVPEDTGETSQQAGAPIAATQTAAAPAATPNLWWEGARTGISEASAGAGSPFISRAGPPEVRETAATASPSADAAEPEHVSERSEVSSLSQAPETPEVSTQHQFSLPEEPVEPPVPFDLEDWLSNVTELGPEDGRPENES